MGLDVRDTHHPARIRAATISLELPVLRNANGRWTTFRAALRWGHPGRYLTAEILVRIAGAPLRDNQMGEERLTRRLALVPSLPVAVVNPVRLA